MLYYSDIFIHLSKSFDFTGQEKFPWSGVTETTYSTKVFAGYGKCQEPFKEHVMDAKNKKVACA